MKGIYFLYFIFLLPCISCKAQESQVKSRVQQIYNYICTEYNRGNNNAASIANSRYLCTSLRTIYQESETTAKRHGDIPPIDYDHWINAQDYEHLSFVIGRIVPNGNRYNATVILNNSGQSNTVILNMIKEKGMWMVYDFISPTYTERSAIYQYLAGYAIDKPSFFKKAYQNKWSLYEIVRDPGFKKYMLYTYGNKKYQLALKYTEVCAPISYDPSVQQYCCNGAQAGMFGENEVDLTYDAVSNEIEIVILDGAIPVM